MKIGTYYYPEQWPREQWTRDFDNIANAGLKIIHLGEFAWGTIEPKQSEYQLDWLETCFSLATERDLDVILCTPTAVIPAWMAQKHPDIFITGQRFGGRRHANHLHPVYVEESCKVATQLASRFGRHPSLIGWQIDNELSSTQFDQSEFTHQAFRQWLLERYKTIDALNQAWGCAFWNTFYTSWDQIKFPAGRDPNYRNQHESLDASRFWSSSFAAFTLAQAKILKSNSHSSAFVSTNFMPFHMDCDPADFRDSLSLWAWDAYPITGWGREHKDESYRMADPAPVAVMHDQMRCQNGRWALVEVQPGQVNWSGYPVLPYPGAIRLLLWQAIAHGCELITVYRWRQPNFGIETFHDGLVQWDGQTLSEGGKQFAQVAREAKSITQTSPSDYRPLKRDNSVPTVGLLHDHDQLWCYASMRQAARWDQGRLVAQYHAAIERISLHVDVLTSESSIDRYPVVVAPGLQMMTDQLVEKLQRYVKQGGHLILTGRSGIFDQFGQAPMNQRYAARLSTLIGADVSGYDALPESTFGAVDFQGATYKWGIWADLLEPTSAKVLGTYCDQFYAGKAAVVQNRLGAGVCTFVGPIDEGPLTNAVVESVISDLGLQVVVTPERTRLHRMNGVQIFLNFSVYTHATPAQPGATFIIGSESTGPGDVSIWKA